jgi:hypothetical protein
MPESVVFPGAILKYFDVRQAKEGGEVFCRIHLAANFAETVREKMEWENIPDSVTQAKLAGALAATNFILTPSDKQLKKYELNFDIHSVEDFEVVSLKDDEGEIRGRELRFIVRTPKEGVEALCGEYIRRVGRAPGSLKIGYIKQEQLPFEANGAAHCIFCANKLPFEDAAKTLHVNGAKCQRAAAVQ